VTSAVSSEPSDGRPRVLVIEHESDSGPGRFELPLRQAVELDVRRPDLGDPLPSDLAAHAGLLVLGGSMGASDDDVAPWLPATRRLLAAGVETGLPTVGICLGAQLLAVATGGRVRRGEAGLEVGVVPLDLAPAADDDPLMRPVVQRLGRRPVAAQFHQDAITELPPGAVPLATGERYPHQAFRLGDAAWGLQYHPEVTAADFATWLRDGHGAVQAAGLHAPDVAARYQGAEPALAALADVHARTLAGLFTGSRLDPRSPVGSDPA
jgi:GMP synthase-like glutamine amidotransferase